MRPLTFFFKKFNTEQFLFEEFPHIMYIFGSVEPQSQSIFQFLYIKIFQRWQSFEPPSYTQREIDKCALSRFLFRIQR